MRVASSSTPLVAMVALAAAVAAERTSAGPDAAARRVQDGMETVPVALPATAAAGAADDPLSATTDVSTDPLPAAAASEPSQSLMDVGLSGPCQAEAEALSKNISLEERAVHNCVLTDWLANMNGDAAILDYSACSTGVAALESACSSSGGMLREANISTYCYSDTLSVTLTPAPICAGPSCTEEDDEVLAKFGVEALVKPLSTASQGLVCNVGASVHVNGTWTSPPTANSAVGNITIGNTTQAPSPSLGATVGENTTNLGLGAFPTSWENATASDQVAVSGQENSTTSVALPPSAAANATTSSALQGSAAVNAAADLPSGTTDVSTDGSSAAAASVGPSESCRSEVGAISDLISAEKAALLNCVLTNFINNQNVVGGTALLDYSACQQQVTFFKSACSSVGGIEASVSARCASASGDWAATVRPVPMCMGPSCTDEDRIGLSKLGASTIADALENLVASGFECEGGDVGADAWVSNAQASPPTASPMAGNTTISPTKAPSDGSIIVYTYPETTPNPSGSPTFMPSASPSSVETLTSIGDDQSLDETVADSAVPSAPPSHMPSANDSGGEDSSAAIDYNPRIELCPGYEESLLKGYTSLSALQSDLADYYSSLETAAEADSSSPNTLDQFMDDRRKLANDGRRIRRGYNRHIRSTEEVGTGIDASEAGGQLIVDGAGLLEEVKLDGDNTPETMGGSSGHEVAAEIDDGQAVKFQICPNSELTFKDKLALIENMEALVLETPSVHPIEIGCLDGAHHVTRGDHLAGGCVLSGGEVHVEFKHRTRSGVGHYPITISGITFHSSSRTSILMNDPHGHVNFRGCAWEDNRGVATFLIDGTYSSQDDSLDLNSGNGPGEFPNDSLGRRRQLVDGSDHEEFARVEEGGELSTGLPDAAQRTAIFIEQCSFSRNTGNATIKVSSYHDLNNHGDIDPGGRRNLEPSMEHFIDLAIQDTTFELERMETSVISNHGARLQSSGCIFVNNTAESIIRSELGTVVMTSTEFNGNDVRGDGVVVLDLESSLEANEGNCAVAVSTDQMNGLDTISERQGDTDIDAANALSAEADSNGTSPSDGEANAPSTHCEGINSGGVCMPFGVCNAMTPTDEPTPQQPATPIDGGYDGLAEACYSDWDELVDAVRDLPPDQRDFTICPNATLTATPSNPVVIDSDYITIQCGTEKESQSGNQCVISGGHSHFHIVGSSKGVQLAGLTMTESTGSSVMAVGRADATLNLRDCEWIRNEGAASAILIHNDESFNATSIEDLDILHLLKTSSEGAAASAMSVEVTDCRFLKNEFTFGAIANIGGTLSVYKSRFVENTSLGGDISLNKRGSGNIQGSCFADSASVSPGIIFVETGSELIDNTNNYGFGNTAGGYAGGTCTAVFHETDGANCLSLLSCDGSCAGFSSSVCSLDADASPKAPSVAPQDDLILVPAYTRSEGAGSEKIAPIIVASLVGVFVVFGFLGIIMRRQKLSKNAPSNTAAERSSCGGVPFCCCCKKQDDDTDPAFEEVEDGGSFGNGDDAA